MSDDFAVDPQASEAGLPEEWREHVRELRSENARRRKENQELRGQLAALASEAEQSRAAQAAAAELAARDAARLATVHHRLKEAEMSRLTRNALHEAVDTAGQASRGTGRASVDLGRAQRLLELVPAPVDLDADLVVDDEGQVTLEPAAGERLKSYVEELADLVSVESRVSPPPVGGEPPRPAHPSSSPLPNAWDPAGQRTPAGKARATLEAAAAANAVVLDGLV